jgi:glyoxylase-like metal-dependent hydrolase (beta-lactamase superfamily II)
MAISFYSDFDPAYGEVAQLAPLVRRVVAKNPNPFTWKGTGVYLVGRGDVAVIDPGPTLDEHLDAIQAALGPDEQINHIVVTHTHTDHTAGIAKLIARTGARTYGFGPHGLVPEHDPLESISFDEYFTPEEKTKIDKEWADMPDELKREGPDIGFRPDVTVAHGESIIGQGWSLEGVHTPGHTSNHLCYAMQDDGNGQRVLFTGDHVMGWSTSVISPPDGDLFDYLNSLELLLGRDDDRYWPTHGTAITDPKPFVRSFIEHRRGREQQIISGLGEHSATIKDLVPTMYAAVDKRLWRAAANSVYSHLLSLYRDERARPTEGDPSLTATWQLC